MLNVQYEKEKKKVYRVEGCNIERREAFKLQLEGGEREREEDGEEEGIPLNWLHVTPYQVQEVTEFIWIQWLVHGKRREKRTSTRIL